MAEFEELMGAPGEPGEPGEPGKPGKGTGGPGGAGGEGGHGGAGGGFIAEHARAIICLLMAMIAVLGVIGSVQIHQIEVSNNRDHRLAAEQRLHDLDDARKIRNALVLVCNRTNDARAELYLIRQPGQVAEEFGGPALEKRLPLSKCSDYYTKKVPRALTPEETARFIKDYKNLKYPRS